MTMSRFLLAPCLAVLATPAFAEPVMVDFTAKSANSSVAFMTSDADGVFELKSLWDPIDAGGGPMAGLQGPCFGTARMTGGKMTGDGYCAYKDPEGNTAFVHWWMDNTASPAGAWALAGGTGRWATANGGGLWSDSPGESEAISLTHITGMVDVK
jgi:hypothetical protein